ncbi:MAG: hypothetical protein AAGL69_04020 [Pseudomonadota bacterium]
MSQVDYLEVSRAAHELTERHGNHAHVYASQLAQNAKDEGNSEESDFWKAVSTSLMPRKQ